MLLGLTERTPTVMMSVFEGGDGSTSGGRSERSRESGDLLPDDARERMGDGRVACMFAIICVAKRNSLVSWMSCCGEWKSKAVTACVLYQSWPSSDGWSLQYPHASSNSCSASIAKARTPATTFPASMSHVLLLSRQFLGVIALPRLLLPNALCRWRSPDLGGRVNDGFN
jgi:hypothetical protein